MKKYAFISFLLILLICFSTNFEVKAVTEFDFSLQKSVSEKDINDINVTYGELTYTTQDKQVKNYTTSKNFETTFVPQFLTSDYFNQLFFSRKDDSSIYSIDTSLPTTQKIISYTDFHDLENNSRGIGLVYDIKSNIEGTVFAVCKTIADDFFIIYKKRDSSNFKLYQKLTIPLNTTMPICLAVSVDNNFLILANDSKIYKLFENEIAEISNSETLSNLIYKNIVFENIIDIKLDFYDTLYVLSKNAESYSLTRLNKNADAFSFSNNILNDTKTFEFNYLNGEILLLKENTIDFITITNSATNFINIITSSYPNYKDEKLDVNMLKTNSEAIVYEFENSLYAKVVNEKKLILQEDSVVIGLKQTETGYYFVIIPNMEKENICGFIKVSNLTKLTTTTKTCRVITQTQVYNYPTSYENLYTINYGIPYTIEEGTITVATGTIITDANGVAFSEIELGAEKYYINSNSLMEISKRDLLAIVDANAKTKNQTTVYQDENCSIELTTLDANTNIKVLSINNKIAKITWGDGTFVGYIYTENFEKFGITNTQLIGLICLSVCILIAIITLISVGIVNSHNNKVDKN